MAEETEKQKALKAALSQIEKDFGKGAIMKLSEKPMAGISVIPTGALPLDIALGVGGVPRGRVIEIFGTEGGGKSTLALQIIAQSQKQGGTGAFIDAEHAFDPTYAKGIGVDTDNLLISQPDDGEQALNIVDTLVRSGAVDVIAVDSVAALVPRVELEGEIGEPQVAVQARLMSQALRKLTGHISKTKTCTIFINQIREKIGVMFGSPETTPGGRALKFYSSVRLDIRRKASIKKGDEIIGNEVVVKVVKNKVAAPFRRATFDLIFGKGTIRENCIVDLAVEHKLIQKSGAWFSCGNIRLGQGREGAAEYLRQHPELTEELETKIKQLTGLPVSSPEEKVEPKVAEKPKKEKKS